MYMYLLHMPWLCTVFTFQSFLSCPWLCLSCIVLVPHMSIYSLHKLIFHKVFLLFYCVANLYNNRYLLVGIALFFLFLLFMSIHAQFGFLTILQLANLRHWISSLLGCLIFLIYSARWMWEKACHLLLYSVMCVTTCTSRYMTLYCKFRWNT